MPVERISLSNPRSDVQDYLARFARRQEVINEEVVGFSRKVCGGVRVLDPTAGPAGSYDAVINRGGQWVGNDVSPHILEPLRARGASVRVSPAHALEAADAEFDGVFFVFGLNNVVFVERALQEAHRVTKSNGFVIACDPGPSKWACDVLLGSLKDHEGFPSNVRACLEQTEFFREGLRSFLDSREVDVRQHGTGVLSQTLGLSFEEFFAVLETFGSRPREISSGWWQFALKSYWYNVLKAAEKSGFHLERLGSISSTLSRGKWLVQPVVEHSFVEAGNLPDRVSSHLIFNRFVTERIQVDDKFIFAPIFSLVKDSAATI